MKAIGFNTRMVTILFLNILFFISCSNDTDLLTDALMEAREAIDSPIVNDYFEIDSYESVVLDLLSNDTYAVDAQVQIIDVSKPSNGTLVINDDHQSVTFTPNITSDQNQNPKSDATFTYTTELKTDGTSSRVDTGTVNISINPKENEDATENDDTTRAEEGTNNGIKANLLFRSGFEGIRLSSPKDGYQYLTGTDTETGFSWPMKILGSDFNGIHRVNDAGGAAIDNSIVRTSGPNGNETSTLFQRVNYDVQVTQTPYQINNIKENPKELYITYWMKTDDTAVKGSDKWRAIWEYKTDDYASNKNGFRMIAFMATDFEGKPYWLFQGDSNPQNPIWQTENRTVPLLLNEWFKVEYYIKWSDGPDGYASMKVNGQLIGEHTGATTANSYDMDFIMLTQVYGNSYPMHQWVDDIEIWDALPN